ncbi:MAG: hypothetical protein LBO64_06445 [Desulfovibrio sp.]|nr:hypothetical protein [Desulfovibrio sp.]
MSETDLAPRTSFVFQPTYNSSGGARHASPEDKGVPVGRTPRVSRMMALAIHLRSLVDNGHVKDYATLADLGHVSRARITQIMDLTLLAPDIQESLLFLPKIEKGRDTINERTLRGIVLQPLWETQRELWTRLRAS